MSPILFADWRGQLEFAMPCRRQLSVTDRMNKIYRMGKESLDCVALFSDRQSESLSILFIL